MMENEENRLIVTADCICDLPVDTIEKENIKLVPYYIETENGIFADGFEISDDNVFECMARGERVVSWEPSIEEYYAFFQKRLLHYHEIVHLCIGSEIAESYERAMVARNKLGDNGHRVFVIDSRQLSGGLGILVLKANEMRKAGFNGCRIMEMVDRIKDKVVTSFISKDIFNLMLNKRVSTVATKFCRLSGAHPVIRIKNGEMKVSGMHFSNYRKSIQRYVYSIMRECEKYRPKELFFVQAGCDSNEINLVRELLTHYDCYGKIIEMEASATVSANCGAHTFGLLFITSDNIDCR